MEQILGRDYALKTTFWEDFSIADVFGEKTIENTFNRAFNEWKDEDAKKQIELRKINENMKSIIQPDGSIFYETLYDYKKVNEIEDIDEQIELVRQVIDKVILDRPSRNILNIEIHNKVDNEVEKLAYDTFRHVKIC